MNSFRLSIVLSALLILSTAINITFAAPVTYQQVQQVVNVKPGKANVGSYAQLRLASDDPIVKTNVGDDPKTGDDDRVITETRTEIVEDDSCDCPAIQVRSGGFPKWALLGLAAVPAAFLIKGGDDKSPTPTPSVPGTPTTVLSPTPTPTVTPTVTPTPPTTPTPEPVPEPMTILLFGTGLAGVGIVARRKLRKKDGN